MDKTTAKQRIISILAFSFLFAYLLSFVFEGQVLYSLTDYFNISSSAFIFAAIVAHFAGLICYSFFAKNSGKAKKTMLYGICICFVFTIPFYFHAYYLWVASLIICAFACGCAVAAWGYYLKSCTPKHERIKTSADVLIYSNILMILINLVAIHLSPFAGLSLSMVVLLLAALFTAKLPSNVEYIAETSGAKVSVSLKAPMLLLSLFVIILTINSGLMYQVFNPAFEHLTWLTSWYWAIPYIIALFIMRNMPVKIKRAYFLYVGMAIIMASFIAFMFLDRSAISYLVVDTLMLFACGIFDLFWWSIIGELLEYSDNPVRVFGFGLSANVLGVLIGGLLGFAMFSLDLPSANVTVIALAVVCVTLIVLPALNRKLVLLLKSHTYLMAYSTLEEKQQKHILGTAKIIDPPTDRENEVLKLILECKANKDIAAELCISGNTVKTHIKNIYSKYSVSSRAQLISKLLKNQNI